MPDSLLELFWKPTFRYNGQEYRLPKHGIMHDLWDTLALPNIVQWWEKIESSPIANARFYRPR